MDHVVYLDTKAQELNKILHQEKSMIIRGAMGRKLPYGRVFEGDVLYFIENKGDGLVKAKAKVSKVFCSDKMMTEESEALLAVHAQRLALTDTQYKRWAGKRYLVLVEINEIEALSPFLIDKSGFGNMDDWLLVEDIERVKNK